jgi:hypothetical protein
MGQRPVLMGIFEPLLPRYNAGDLEETVMAHREQRSNREKKKPKQDKKKADQQQPSVFASQTAKPKSVTPQPPQNKPGS